MTAPSIDLDASDPAPAWSGFGRLRHAARLLVRVCASGDIAKVNLRRPDRPLAEVSIRAPFLAFVVRGGLPLHGRRLNLLGALVEGRLDLGDAAIAGSLWFYRCTFDSPVLLDGSRVAGGVTFASCHLSGLLAQGCVIANDLALNAGCTVDSDLRLTRARIGGDLDCARLELSGGSNPAEPRRARLANAVRVGDGVRLIDGFQSVGEVRFSGARVRGDFRASGRFNGNVLPEGGRGAALLMDRIVVDGSVRFDAAGRVALRRARIGGDFDTTGANFDGLGDASWDEGGSLVLDRARIDGALILRELQAPLLGASFVDTRVGTLADDARTWGERLLLDGFACSRLGEGPPLDTVFRTGWRERQDPAHLKAQFRVQPWRRLIRVLRRMGHEHHEGSAPRTLAAPRRLGRGVGTARAALAAPRRALHARPARRPWATSPGGSWAGWRQPGCSAAASTGPRRRRALRRPPHRRRATGSVRSRIRSTDCCRWWTSARRAPGMWVHRGHTQCAG